MGYDRLYGIQKQVNLPLILTVRITGRGGRAAPGRGQEGCLGSLDALSLDLGSGYTDMCPLWNDPSD